MTEFEKPAVDDETFMDNVDEALVNGYDFVCARCGTGMNGDGMEIHDRRCPEFDERSLR